jgi:nuclear pore complex protein Nup214
VDSIGWIRDDSIVIGCVRLNEDDNEEGYLVQVIRSEENTFCEVSWSSTCFLFSHRIHITCYIFLAKLQKFHLQTFKNMSV